jgi:predicted permease
MRDVDAELRFHFESRIEDLVAGGMSRADAHARAEQEFGDVESTRTALLAIDQRSAARRSRREWLAVLLADARYAIRSLGRTPDMALAMLVMLALGVGVNAAMFTFLDSVFLRQPAGVVDPHGVRRVWRYHKFNGGAEFWSGYSYAQFDELRRGLADRARLAVYTEPWKTKTGAGDSQTNAEVSNASVGFFQLTGAHAEIGRLYDSTEDRLQDPQPVAVISHRYWSREFGGDRSAIGKRLVVGGSKYTIVGVVSEPFAGVDLDATDVWLPLAFEAAGRREKVPWWKSPNVNAFSILMRPTAGVSDALLEQRATTILRRPVFGWLNDSTTTVRVGSLVRAAGPGAQKQEVRIAIRLVGVALVVLLIACANVVNLLLARAVRRRREIAVRLALGISRARLVRLLLVESAVLASCAAAVGVIVAFVAGAFLRRVLLPDIHWATGPLDWRVVSFATAVAMGAGLLAGLIPALQSASTDVTHALKSGGPGVTRRSRLRSTLVASQAALSVLLLSGAALFVKSLSNVQNIDIGYDAPRIITAGVGFDDRTRAKDPSIPERLAIIERRAAALPGVANVALAMDRPMYNMSWLDFFTAKDSIRAGFMPTWLGVSRGYFAATGIHFVHGRDFAEGSADHSVIVNEEMARLAWPGATAIGQCVRFTTRDAPCYHVIGVVRNSRERQVIEEPQPKYYLPLSDLPPAAKGWAAGVVTIRVDPAAAASVIASLRTMIRQEFPGGIPSVVRLSDYLEPQYRPWRLGTTLFTAFGVLALIVAVVGIYSTASYGVQQRTHEFGVRIALGATLGDVMRLVLSEGTRIVATGIAIGIALTTLAGRAIASLLYGVKPTDASTAALVALTLLASGILAALAPAWRAARVDPARTLREE